MKKETFCNILNLIKKQIRLDEEKSAAFEKIIDDNSYIIYSTYMTEPLITILEREFEDENDWIYWWIYEQVEKIVYDKDKEINVEKVEDFYDFLKNLKTNKGEQ